MVAKSLTLKASLYVALIIFLLSTVLAAVSYQRDKEMYYERLKSLAMMNAILWESYPDDVEKIKNLIETNPSAYKTDEKVQEFQPMLDGALKENLAANAYVFLPQLTANGDKNSLKMMIANEQLYQVGLTPGTDYPLSPELQRAYQEMESSGIGISDAYQDNSGSWVTVLKKLKNAKGETIGIFGLDFNYGTVQAELNAAMLTNAMIALGLEVVFIVISIFLIRRTLRPAKELAELTLQAANGDLSVTAAIHSRDELGQLSVHFNTMVTNVRRLIANVQETSLRLSESSSLLSHNAEQTAKASEQIAVEIQEVAAGADSQTTGAQETTRAMEEMALGIQRIAESASSVSEAAVDVSTHAATGNEVMMSAVRQMNVIQSSVKESSQTIEELFSHSQEISKITDVITDISNQTNLLALNAAIEAARAGEAGRGFAVVADEVRKLAEQSKHSSDQISQLIGGVQTGTNRAMEVMIRTEHDVRTGAKAADEAGHAFERIVSSIQSITGQIQEVSASAEEMSASSEEITATIEQVATTARDAAMYTQNVASASEEQLASMQEISSSTNTLN
ncbi:MAG: methyl-accepting chemotaxis protein, partial [Clostridia bacterium]